MSRRPQPRVTISARPQPSTAVGPTFASGKVEYSDEDGSFRITGVRGLVVLAATSNVGVLKSIRRDGVDLAAAPLELTGTEQLDDIEIVLTAETGQLAGMVTDAKGQPAQRSGILAFPQDSRRWYAGSPFVLVARSWMTPPPSVLSRAVAPAQPAAAGVPPPAAGAPSLGAAPPAGNAFLARAPGQYVFQQLLPGPYFVVAIEDPTGIITGRFDADTLAALRARAVSVVVVPGESTVADLRLVKP